MRQGHLVLGIDPGINGAIAGIWTEPPEPDWNSHMRPQTWVVNMPHVRSCKGRPTNEIDVKAFCFMLQHNIRELGEPQRIHLMMEQVWVHPGMNGATMGPLLRGAGILEGAAIAHGIHVSRVPPSVWKAYYPELSPPHQSASRRTKKLLALDLARKLWPEIDLSKAKDDGKAEALLIAKYALREVV